jgi:VanZ family protein
VWRWLPVVLWTALILSASNDNFSTAHSGGWMRAIFGRDLPALLHIMVRKSAHMLEYGILAILGWRAHRSMSVPLLVVLAVASVDEWMQSRTLARTGTAWDVLLDFCAALIVVGVVQSQTGLTRRREDAKKDNR